MGDVSVKTRSVFRIIKDKSNPYVQIHKGIFEEKGMSYKAKGLLCDMLSKPDDWVFCLAYFQKRSTDKETSIRSAVKELRKYGYAETYAERENGRIARWVTNIYDVPQKRLIKQGTSCGQDGDSTTTITSTWKSSTGKSSATNNNNTNNDHTKNNNVNGPAKSSSFEQDTPTAVIDNDVLENEITNRLRKLVRTANVQREDIDRLAAEVTCHVVKRPSYLAWEHSLNAAMKLIKDGKWSTPRTMAQVSADMEARWQVEKESERQDAVHSKLGKIFAEQMRSSRDTV